jgi:hypothetical protein
MSARGFGHPVKVLSSMVGDELVVGDGGQISAPTFRDWQPFRSQAVGV